MNNIELNWTNLARWGCPDEPGVYFCKWSNGDLETYEYFAGDSETSPYWNKSVGDGRLYVTWWCEIPVQMDPEFATSIECPACSEISLQRIGITKNKPFIETWECDCGYTQCFHVPTPKTPMEVTNGNSQQ